MTELSLNVLDVAQNSVKAGAKHIDISVVAEFSKDLLTITIKDDGCGMTEEQVKSVEDPFFTTRTTRKVGLGIPFFKQAAELAAGGLSITSQKGVGTTVTTTFALSSIDRMPLGDMTSTMHQLITMNTNIDFCYTYRVDDRVFTLDTAEFKEVLGGVPLDVPEVSLYVRDYLRENKAEVDQNRIF